MKFERQTLAIGLNENDPLDARGHNVPSAIMARIRCREENTARRGSFPLSRNRDDGLHLRVNGPRKLNQVLRI